MCVVVRDMYLLGDVPLLLLIWSSPEPWVVAAGGGARYLEPELFFFLFFLFLEEEEKMAERQAQKQDGFLWSSSSDSTM